MSARVTVIRGSGWMDFFRAYRIMVNSEERGRLRRKSSLTIDVPAGTHEITAQIDWCTSNLLVLDCAVGETLHLDVFNPHGPWRASKRVFDGPQEYLTLRVR